MTSAVKDIYDMHEFQCWVQAATQDAQLLWREGFWLFNQSDKWYSVIGVVRNIAPLNIKPIYISQAPRLLHQSHYFCIVSAGQEESAGCLWVEVFIIERWKMCLLHLDNNKNVTITLS